MYNIYDDGRGKCSQMYGSGMLVEDVGNKRIYRCNDVGLDTAFDRLVFTVEKL